MALEKHKALTAVRARAYGELFGCKPSAVFPPHALFKKPDERFLIIGDDQLAGWIQRAVKFVGALPTKNE